MSPTTAMVMVFVAATCLLIGVARSAVIPEKEIVGGRWGGGNGGGEESWAEEYNLVEPPPARMLFMKMFDNPNPKYGSQASLKSIIKALYQMDSFNENTEAVDPAEEKGAEAEASVEETNNEDTTTVTSVTTTEESSTEQDYPQQHRNNEVRDFPETVDESTIVPPPSLDLQPPQKEASTLEIPEEEEEVEEHATQKLGILLEDIVDSIVHLPVHMEADRTDKFTHSIRYGYGVPFHPKGI